MQNAQETRQFRQKILREDVKIIANSVVHEGKNKHCHLYPYHYWLPGALFGVCFLKPSMQKSATFPAPGNSNYAIILVVKYSNKEKIRGCQRQAEYICYFNVKLLFQHMNGTYIDTALQMDLQGHCTSSERAETLHFKWTYRDTALQMDLQRHCTSNGPTGTLHFK